MRNKTLVYLKIFNKAECDLVLSMLSKHHAIISPYCIDRLINGDAIGEYLYCNRVSEVWSLKSLNVFNSRIKIDVADLGIILSNQPTSSEPVETQEITRDQAAGLHEIACKAWKQRIMREISCQPFSDKISVGEDTISEAYAQADEALTTALNAVFTRPKKKITKTLTRWANIHSDGVVLTYYTKASALEGNGNNPLGYMVARAVEISGTYEVEE